MRLRQLDVLRAFAVLLVMIRHLNEGKDNPAMLALVAQVNRAPIELAYLPELVVRLLYRMGWAGVDLFFVLSGFLVSGLLFREHQQRADVRVGRFLIRRGFKIYPMFYLFLLSTLLAIGLFTTRKLSVPAIVCEVLFVQNYGPNMWGHTWSLAVEEHFYLLLGLLLFLLSRRQRIDLVPRLFPLVALGFLAARVTTTLLVPEFDFKTHVFATHLRLDALFYGVALSYLWHFERPRLAFAEQGTARVLLLLGGLLLFVPACFWKQDNPWMRTVGLSGLSLGGAMLVLWAMSGPPVASRVLGHVADGLAKMGFYSYAIYLWHVPVLVVGVPIAGKVASRILGLPLGLFGELVVYVAGTIGVAVVTARLVELPALKLRDRLFPSVAR